MMRILFICACIGIVVSKTQYCSEKQTLDIFKQPISYFSMRLLDRVAEDTGGTNFVFSPIATWLRLIALVEGASGKTKKEIFEALGLTIRKRKTCYRRTFRKIFNIMQDNEVALGSKRLGLVMIDENIYSTNDVNRGYIIEAELSKDNKVLLLNFSQPEDAAFEANDEMDYQIQVNSEIDPYDFDNTRFVTFDVAYYKMPWKKPFNILRTTPQPFKSIDKLIEVDMMNQLGYWSYASFPLLNIKVLELPCLDERLSMLIFLPIKRNIFNLFDVLKNYVLDGIFNQLDLEGQKLVNVSLPRFEITTEMANLHELLQDMGLKRIFDSDKAEFHSLTKKDIFVSFMFQKASIVVNETHNVEQVVEHVDEIYDFSGLEEFKANETFGYAIVHKVTNIVLFGGMYTGVDQRYADLTEEQISILNARSN